MPTEIIGYINILIGIVDIFVGSLVLSSNPNKAVNRAYFLCTLTMGLWSFSLFFYNNPFVMDSSAWLKIVYFIAYLMTFGQINFALKFHEGVSKRFSLLLTAILAPLFLFGFYLLFVSDSIVISTYYDKSINTVIAQMGRDYIYYFIPILFSLFFLFGIHIQKGRKLDSLKKKQTQFYWIGGLLMIAPLVYLDFILPIFFSNTRYYQYSTLGNILWAIIIAYSIYNTRFLDVRLVLGKVVEALLKSGYLFLIFLIYTRWNESDHNFEGGDFVFILIVISLTLSFILNWINEKTSLLVQKKFIYSRYDPIEQIQKYASSNSQELNITNILKNSKDLIEETLNPDKVSIILFDSRSKQVVYQEKVDFPSLTSETTTRFINNWENLNSNPILIFSEIDIYFSSGKEIIDSRKKEILDFMKDYKVEVIIPFELKSSYQGSIILGNKKDNSLYSQTDITFLESITRNANIAIERAILYEELQTFNQTLQQKVYEQTKELQQKIEELEEARRKESDMIDIMGHELRTPATIVKLNAAYLDKFLPDIRSNPDEYIKYVKRIQDSIQNEIILINTLLSSAKLEGDKIELNPEAIDIKHEIDLALHGNENDANEKGLQLVNSSEIDTPSIFADKARTIEVLNNLISNAIKYTDEGEVEVTTKFDEDFVSVSIRDTGKGIPEKDIPKLGQKFYRLNNYVESEQSDEVDVIRPGGTGLGLYVTFNLIKKMGGKISVQSEVDRGTIFTFSLPRFLNQISNDKDKTSKRNMFERLGLKK